jgi:hypothetical protein
MEAAIAFTRRIASVKITGRLASGGFTDFAIKLEFLAGMESENLLFKSPKSKWDTAPQ